MKKRNLIIIMGLFVFVMMMGGISYSYFVYNKDIGNVSLDTGEISINISDASTTKTLTNVIPTGDSDGMISSDYLDFTVDGVVDSEKIYYEVYIMPDSNNTLNTNYLKVYLTDQEDNMISPITLYNSLSDSEKTGGKNIYKGLININNDESRKTYSKDFRLRLWLDENYTDVTAKTFEFDVNIYAYNVKNVWAENLSYGEDANCNTVQCQLETLAGN